jgi:hypothetical protein
MHIIEKFVTAKGTSQECEDMVVVNQHFLGIIDGATDKTGLLYNGKTGGRWLAETLQNKITELPAEYSFAQALEQLSQWVSHALLTTSSRQAPPSASLILYSRARREVWRLGSIHLLIDGISSPYHHPLEEISAQARAAYLQLLLESGVSKEELLVNDHGRTLILPILKEEYRLANHPQHHLGYGVFNGKSIPLHFQEVYTVPFATEVVFASDGYLTAADDLQTAELQLQQSLTSDPLRIKEFPATKACGSGASSFDDRAYLRFLTPLQ